MALGSILRQARKWTSSSKFDDEGEEEEVFKELLLETEWGADRRQGQIGVRQAPRP